METSENMCEDGGELAWILDPHTSPNNGYDPFRNNGTIRAFSKRLNHLTQKPTCWKLALRNNLKEQKYYVDKNVHCGVIYKLNVECS